MQPLTEQEKLEMVLSVLAYIDVKNVETALNWLEKISQPNELSEQQAFAKKCFEAYINL